MKVRILHENGLWEYVEIPTPAEVIYGSDYSTVERWDGTDTSAENWLWGVSSALPGRV